MKLKSILPVFIFSTLLIGCKNPLETKDKGIEELNNIENHWVDTYTLASSTARIALAPPVSQLQEIKRNLLSTEVSECLKPAKASLISYMDIQIENFLHFMADKYFYSSEKNPKLVEYLEIKTKCTGKTNSNSNLVAEAKAYIDEQNKEQQELEKSAKDKGISVEAFVAEEAKKVAAEAEAEAKKAEAEAEAASKLLKELESH